MARRFLRLTKETTWGTYDAAGTTILVDLDQANSYTPRPKPVTVDVRLASAYSSRAKKIGSKKMLAGNLNMLVRGSQAAFLASILTPAPGVSVMPSFTADYAIELEDAGNTLVYSRHLGMCVQQGQLGSTSDAQVLRAALQLVGKTTAAITIADFPTPAAADYASDDFLTHDDLSGALSIATARTEFDAFQATIRNILDPKFFESPSPTRIRYCGRDVDWTAKLAYKIATDRSNYEALTAVSASATYTVGAHSLAFAMNSQNFYDNVEDDLDDQKVYLQDLSMQSFWDPAAGTPGDFAVTGA